MKIKLLTNTDYALVHEAEIPPFLAAPDVLLWGSRIFVFLERDLVDSVDVTSYREAFAYTVASG